MVSRKKVDFTTSILRLIKQHWLLIAIVMLATWLRVWNIQDQAIFFGDAAHDLWSAKTAVDQGKLPLLGIASSVPRFKQGPVTVWIEMVVYAIFGTELIWYSLVFASISIAAVIAIYEISVTQVNLKTALGAALILAVMPLAVAHGRVPYHITPIPLMLVLYLYALCRVWKKQNPQNWFWTGLAFAGLFQFELAVTPLFFLVIYVGWQQRSRLKGSFIRSLLVLFGGIGLGLWPQIWHDVTHRFEQLGGFAIWIMYRLVGNTGVVAGGAHMFGWSKMVSSGSALAQYGTRLISVDDLPLFGIFCVLLGLSGYSAFQKWQSRKLPPLIQLSWLGLITLVVAFVLHGSPSEAYFPPFFILVPLCLGYSAAEISAKHRPIVISSLMVWATYTVCQIWISQFFVSNPSIKFNYGPSVSEQREVVEVLSSRYPSVMLRTTDPGGIYPSYFKNIAWLSQSSQLSIVSERSQAKAVVFVEPMSSTLQNYPSARITRLKSIILVEILQL